MDVKEENICRLCLKIVEGDFEIIDENTRKILELLSLRLNLDISKDPIICKGCAEVVQKCFNFKSACMDIKEHILSSAIDKSRAPLELQDVYKEANDIESADVNFICRFCSRNLSGSNFVLLETLMKDITFINMLPVLMPEMDFDIINNYIICTACKQNLECYINYVMNCLDVEGKINAYLQNEDTRSFVQIKLSEILRLELDYVQICAIKQEDILEDIDEVHPEVYDADLIKAEEELNIKDEEMKVSICENPSDTSVHQLEVPCGLKTRIRRTDQMLSTNKNWKAQIFKCSLCTYQAKRKGSLKIHMLTHKDFAEVEMYECSVCSFKTKYKGSLESHTLVHKDITEVEMYKCSMCTYEAKRKNYLKAHMITHKDITDVEMHKCSMCTYETKHKGGLKSHMLLHKDITEVQMYKCSMCTYQAKQKGHLKRHIMLIHKDNIEVEMYKCSKCIYQTRDKSRLGRHILIHKDSTEVEMYKCSMCTYEAKDKHYLKKHMLIHKDNTEVEMYKCPMCTHETKRKRSLKNHMLIHKDVTDVTMYKCPMCIYGTRDKSSLRRHMLIHKDITEVEILKCPMCSFDTKRKGSLRKHIQRHYTGVNV